MTRTLSVSRSAGFTLLELLLALSISALLFSVLALASNTISSEWDSQNEILQDDVEQALYLLRLERSLQGMFPYTYRPQGGGGDLLLVDGSEDSLIWVSTLSPGKPGALNVWRLRNGEEEILLDRAPLAAGFKEDTMEWGDVERISGLAAIRIGYAAYNEADKKLEWIEEWPPEGAGEAFSELPKAVRVSFYRQRRVVQRRDAEFELMAIIKAENVETAN
ncbi:MAG: prepilin-type N-terminal cleavage/methylation domain-containing protein [Gammaproteobacteria bacterium]|nr:prepilin-type N-terminal cleavage/methylation domain-containing protein [Gammaproteobacteria bacterium]